MTFSEIVFIFTVFSVIKENSTYFLSPCQNGAYGFKFLKKNVTCYNQMIVAIVGTLTVIIRKYKNKRC
jgi:hypothetical protein